MSRFLGQLPERREKQVASSERGEAHDLAIRGHGTRRLTDSGETRMKNCNVDAACGTAPRGTFVNQVGAPVGDHDDGASQRFYFLRNEKHGFEFDVLIDVVCRGSELKAGDGFSSRL